MAKASNKGVMTPHPAPFYVAKRASPARAHCRYDSLPYVRQVKPFGSELVVGGPDENDTSVRFVLAQSSRWAFGNNLKKRHEDRQTRFPSPPPLPPNNERYSPPYPRSALFYMATIYHS